MNLMKRVIVSGYFTQVRSGHLDLLEGAATLGDYLIVVVNNDAQQILKKGKIVINEADRVRLMENIKLVDEAVLSIDKELSIAQTLKMIARRYPDDELLFANGGDRDSIEDVPEAKVCGQYNIEMKYGVGEKKG